jgi:hypothetical protein
VWKHKPVWWNFIEKVSVVDCTLSNSLGKYATAASIMGGIFYIKANYILLWHLVLSRVQVLQLLKPTFQRHERNVLRLCLFFSALIASSWPRPPHSRGFVITLRHTTLGTTPLDEGSARRRDLFLTTHNTHTRDRHPCPPWESNPQSQQASGGRPTS